GGAKLRGRRRVRSLAVRREHRDPPAWYAHAMDAPPGAVTRLLRAWNDGDPDARDQLLPLVYRELRRQAASYLRRERRDHTLPATALVHEAYLRLVGQESSYAN